MPGAARDALLDPAGAYADAGLLVSSASFPFVASVHYLAGRTPDTTLVLVAVSFANRALTFIDEGKARRAEYDVMIETRAAAAAAAAPPARAASREFVRVATFPETTRRDAGVVFQRWIALRPGAYTLTISLRDVEGSGAAAVTRPIEVPRLGEHSLSSLVLAYRAAGRTTRDSLPRLVANPRSLVTAGRDTTALLYIEGYGLAPRTRVAVSVLDESQTRVASDTVTLDGRGDLASVAVPLPVGRLGMGRLTIVAALPGADTVREPLFVSFGPGLGILSYATMLDYLRYLATPARLDSLRSAPLARRSAEWLDFLRAARAEGTPGAPGATDRVRGYFERIESANGRFRDEAGPGWLTDRGRVFIALGEPDRIVEDDTPSGAGRPRQMVWSYEAARVELTFMDDLGFGVWHLTPESALRFAAVERAGQVP